MQLVKGPQLKSLTLVRISAVDGRRGGRGRASELGVLKVAWQSRAAGRVLCGGGGA